MAAKIRFINPQGLSRPPTYSQVVEVTGPVRTIYISGQLGTTVDGEVHQADLPHQGALPGHVGAGDEPQTLAAEVERGVVGHEPAGRGVVVQQVPPLAARPDLDANGLLDLFCNDQVDRWCEGVHIPAEAYLALHPALDRDREGAFDLIYGEYVLRESLGQDHAAYHAYKAALTVAPGFGPALDNLKRYCERHGLDFTSKAINPSADE